MKCLVLSLTLIVLCVSSAISQVTSDSCVKKISIKLAQTPTSWGSPVPKSSCDLSVCSLSVGGIRGSIKISKLLPSHSYKLCLNGKPGIAGNDLLLKVGETNGQQGVVNFHDIVTDSIGSYKSSFDQALPAGKYNTKFFVKDTDADVVLILP